MVEIRKMYLYKTGFSAVGSALRSGRRGRLFESGNPDKIEYD